MKTFTSFLLTAIGGLLLGMTIFLSALWIVYGREEAVVSIRSVVISIGITTTVFYLFYRRRLKYLDSEELISPGFRDTSSREFGLDVDRFDFECFKQLIEERFVISARSDNTLKFRKKFTFWSWGAGAFLRFDRNAGKIAVHYFPISGYTRHGTRAVRKMDESLEELIRRSLKS